MDMPTRFHYIGHGKFIQEIFENQDLFYELFCKLKHDCDQQVEDEMRMSRVSVGSGSSLQDKQRASGSDLPKEAELLQGAADQETLDGVSHCKNLFETEIGPDLKQSARPLERVTKKPPLRTVEEGQRVSKRTETSQMLQIHS